MSEASAKCARCGHEAECTPYSGPIPRPKEEHTGHGLFAEECHVSTCNCPAFVAPSVEGGRR